MGTHRRRSRFLKPPCPDASVSVSALHQAPAALVTSCCTDNMTHTVAQTAKPHCSHYYYLLEQVWIPHLEADVGNWAWGAQVSGITGQVFPVNLMAPQLHPATDLKETQGTRSKQHPALDPPQCKGHKQCTSGRNPFSDQYGVGT